LRQIYPDFIVHMGGVELCRCIPHYDLANR